jgi:hypothetical protein
MASMVYQFPKSRRIPPMQEILEVSQGRGARSENPSAWKDAALLMPMQEGAGLLARDVSGYGSHGTLTDMDPATDWVLTERGRALSFDETDDYVDVPNNPYTSAALRERGISMALAVDMTVLATGAGVVARGAMGGLADIGHAGYSAGGVQLVKDFAGGYVLATVYDGDYKTARNNVDSETWLRLGHNVVGMTINPSDSNLRAYCNGLLTATTAVTLAGITFEPALFWIGKGKEGTFWDRINWGAVWLRPLALSEFQQLYSDPWAMYRLRPLVLPGLSVGPPADGPFVRCIFPGAPAGKTIEVAA